MRYLLLKFISLYQILLSPFMRDSCRYAPSCSEYMKEAITIHGVFKGLWMGSKRIGRCHPWHEGGYDPVPEKDSLSDPKSEASDTNNKPAAK